MIILMQSLNEEAYVSRVFKQLNSLEFISRIIVIDGGSHDHTKEALLSHPKTEVYVHPWLDWFHDQNITQRNIGISYVPHGQMFFILDFDERLSDDLIQLLENCVRMGKLDKDNHDHALVSRRTFEVERHLKSPYAIIGEDGWPIQTKQIGQYPDFQPRLFKKRPGMFFINSPHHSLFGIAEGVFSEIAIPDTDIIHYEKNDENHRILIERKWARAQARRKELGLIADKFETKLRPDIEMFGYPKTWEKTTPKGGYNAS